MKIYIRTFGCQMNRADSAALSETLARAGHEAAASADEAQVVIFNTCSVRAHAEERLFQNLETLRRRAQAPGGPVVGLIGCTAALRREELFRAFPFLSFLAGPEALAEVPRLILEGRSREHRCCFASDRAIARDTAETGISAFLPVITGCDNFCSYCVVPLTRGREKSRPWPLVRTEAEVLCRGETREITLLGQNVNSYRDGEADIGFPALLERIAAVPGLARLGFLTSHPKDVSGALFETMAAYPNVYRHLHLPLQSGSDRVLAAMNRGYTSARFREIIARARETVPGLAVTSDIIVGFPGENPADFVETAALVQEIGFDDVYAFKYSDRPGTAAEKLPGKVPEKEKEERLRALWAIQEAASERRNRRLEGSVFSVLVLRRSAKRKGWLVGRTESGKKALFPGGPQLVGKITAVRVARADRHLLYGQAV